MAGRSGPDKGRYPKGAAAETHHRKLGRALCVSIRRRGRGESASADQGAYPYFNISSRLTLPSDARLADISEAKTQHYSLSARDIEQTYARKE